MIMAKCRITTLIPPCGYNLQGVTAAQLIDFEDFGGIEFDGDKLESSALVAKVYGGLPIGIPVAQSTRYTSAQTGRVYAHTLETFVPQLSAQLIASMDLATRRRFVVMFTAASGRRFLFGYESGATFKYAGQTAEAIGAMVTLTAASAYPLFEVSPLAEIGAARAMFDISFDFGAFCETT